jgi:hypothetical protein
MGVSTVETNRDQARFLNLSRSTFETCWDYPYFRDKIFFFLGQDFSIQIKLHRDFYQDKSRLSRFFKIVDTFQDCQDLSRFLDIFWEILLIGICGSIWPSTVKWIKSSNLVRDFWKFKLLLDQDREIIEIFGKSWSRSRLLGLDIDVETNVLKVLRFSRLSRLTLCQCRDGDPQALRFTF